MDQTLQDIRGQSLSFGGIPVLLCGDFRQILPVIKNGTQSNIVDASLKKSVLWSNVKTVHLRKNLRTLLIESTDAADYSLSQHFCFPLEMIHILNHNHQIQFISQIQFPTKLQGRSS